MFETKKTLIVVYKDEMLVNQLKKMVETHDDTESDVVGTRDDSINIVSWTEKVWLANKKAGNIQGKILFLGEIKGTDKLIPVIDVKYDEYGVRFGWAGNQAIVYADPKALKYRGDYDAFLAKLSEFPIPALLKVTKEDVPDSLVYASDSDNPASEKALAEDILADLDAKDEETSERKRKEYNILSAAKSALLSGAEAFSQFGNEVASRSEELFRNKSLMMCQMLFYGVVVLYQDWLEAFMNM